MHSETFHLHMLRTKVVGTGMVHYAVGWKMFGLLRVREYQMCQRICRRAVFQMRKAAKTNREIAIEW